MTPIEKNIFVVDEQGNQYEATYLKRAKGLVKKGRARFIDENTICIACPPEYESEDKNMSENKSLAADEMNNNENKATDKPSIMYCLTQLEKIQEQTEFLIDAIMQAGAIPCGNPGDSGSPGDIAGEAKAKALADMVRSREATNQKLIAFYEKIYDDLMDKKTDKDRIISIVESAAASGECSAEELSELVSNLIGLTKDKR